MFKIFMKKRQMDQDLFDLEKEIIILKVERDSEKTKLELEKEIVLLQAEKATLMRDNGYEIEKVERKHKIAEEDIKHMVKMKEGRLALDHDKKILECERTRDTAIAKVKDEYRDKMEERLQKEVEQTKQMYSEILERLPNINVNMKGRL